MDINDIYLFATIMAIGASGLKYFALTYFRNIYTQKILYLNERLSTLDSEEKIISFSISEYREFTTNLKGGEQYPLSIQSRFLINPQYKQLVDTQNSKTANFDKFVRIAACVYFILLIVITIIHLVLKYL